LNRVRDGTEPCLMEQTGHWEGGEALSGEALLGLLRKRFTEVDFDQARADVLPFIRDADAVVLWGETFFTGLLDRLKVE